MTSQINDALNREAILKLLTDAEVSKVSRAEGEQRLVEGDEYVDLEDLESGVQLVQAAPRTAPGHALPRSAVSEATWAKIIKAVAKS
jgi:thiamine biosynthesis protein ThiC